MMRTVENAMPAVTTELDWTIQDLLKFMIQTGRFRDVDGTISQARVEAAQAYLQTDWERLAVERFKSPGFDPDRPFLGDDWIQDDPQVAKDLASYVAMKRDMKEQMDVFKGGPNNEWTRAENALLMCQRVDLWCSGPKEVERAVQHLYKLGKKLNDDREVEYPPFIAEFYPGCDDMDA